MHFRLCEINVAKTYSALLEIPKEMYFAFGSLNQLILCW